MHTLYHLPDIAAGIAELRRVLRPGGRALVATNGANHVLELGDLPARAVRALYELDVPNWMAGWRFTLDDAPTLLRERFDEVQRVDVPGSLVVPDVDAVVAYVDSMRGFETRLPPHADWHAVLAEVRRMVEDEVRAHGAFRATAEVGCLVCR